ncbi:MAG: hypothetical protein RIS44_2366 [Pseudomonadota bacterium]
MSESTPSPSLMANLRTELMRHAPFMAMQADHVDQFLTHAEQAYFAPGEVLLDPSMGPVQALYWLRQGSITGRRGLASMTGGLHYEVGDLFPVGAVMGSRTVTSTYTANVDCFCLLLASRHVHALAEKSAPFADFLQRRALHFFELVQRALQTNQVNEALAQQSLEAKLGTLPRKKPLSCNADTSLQNALTQMHGRRVGSVVVVSADGAPEGILTRHDILERVTLAQKPLGTPIREVMSRPVQTLHINDTLQDAALLMSRHGIRHVPVCEAGVLVNIVSERDLFSLQGQSIKQLSSRIRSAAHLADFQLAATDIRRFARTLLGQGLAARQLTALISHLNDVLTDALVQWLAPQCGVAMHEACWLAFGSEGRSEQTIATDQDNGLIFVSTQPEVDRALWLQFAKQVNEALDACGYPLCQGGVMSSNPDCCLTADEWTQRFSRWIEQGSPDDLLRASIYFDLRPVSGQMALALPLRDMLSSVPAQLPRFIKQLADNVLRNRAPLNWLGAVETSVIEGVETIDLKHHGTALFVDAARLYALALGCPAVNTRERLLQVANALNVPTAESESWVAAFEFLQMLRLRRQFDAASHGAGANQVAVDALNNMDKKALKESLRVARSLQQRIQLDYPSTR